MGTVRENREKALLFSGLLFSDDASRGRALALLRKEFGAVLLESPELAWEHTNHYRNELGEIIIRQFFLFERIISPERIADIKILTNRLEAHLARKDRRTVNIDPGYLTAAKVVLATTKNYSHRIYLGNGIYAEVTLSYRNGSYLPFPYTYADYRKTEYVTFFMRAREVLMNK